MNLLCLLGASNLSGTNSPDRLVGNDDLGPVRNLISNGLQLGSDNVDGLVGFSLFQALSNAQNDTDISGKGGLRLGCNECIILAENSTTFGVADESPFDVAVLELVNRDFASEGPIGLIKDVLRSDLKSGVEMLAS